MKVHQNDGFCVCVFVCGVLTKCNFRSDYSCPLALSVFANKSALKIMVFFVACEMNGRKINKTHTWASSGFLNHFFSVFFAYCVSTSHFYFSSFDSLSLAYFASFDLLFCRLFFFLRFVKLQACIV